LSRTLNRLANLRLRTKSEALQRGSGYGVGPLKPAVDLFGRPVSSIHACLPQKRNQQSHTPEPDCPELLA
jgi:hypothetical protein